METIKQNIVIRQGANFKGKSLLLSGDYSGWEIKWQIRKRYKGVLLAEGEVEVVYDDFVIGANTYENHTLITPVLEHLVSETLPPALGDKIGQNAWVYDVKMKSPNESTVYTIFEGLVNVTPEVTVFEDNN
ncbi:MAG: hypothetical protein ACOVOQ_16620 [Flavobacterium sp.]|jgi:hypothetical protein